MSFSVILSVTAVSRQDKDILFYFILVVSESSPGVLITIGNRGEV